MDAGNSESSRTARDYIAPVWEKLKETMNWSKDRVKRILFRDVKITKRQFATLATLVWLVASGILAIVISVWASDALIPHEQRNDARIVSSIFLTLGVVFGGVLIDSQTDKRRVALGFAGAQVVGIGLITVFFQNMTIYFIGLILSSFFTTALIITMGTFLILYTSPLDRARVNVYTFFVGGLGIVGLYLFIQYVSYPFFFLLVGTIVGFFVYLLKDLVWYEKAAGFTSTMFRGSFWKEMNQRGIFLYALAQFLFTFICGVSFGLFVERANFFIFILILFAWSIVVGIVLDNFGRKVTMVMNTLLLSLVVTFSGSSIDFPVDLLSGIFSAILICALIITNVISGDLGSSEINGRSLSLNYFAYVTGFLGGILLNTQALGELDAEGLLILNDVTSFFLILMMAILIPLRETLRARDLEFREKLKQLYVIYEENGILLYHHKFYPEEEGRVDPDLASGGISGATQIFREITQSQKQMKILDQEDRKILFEYGELVVVALITTESLYLIRQKLRQFLDDFERTFRREIKKMSGDVERFEATELLVKKHFF